MAEVSSEQKQDVNIQKDVASLPVCRGADLGLFIIREKIILAQLTSLCYCFSINTVEADETMQKPDP